MTERPGIGSTNETPPVEARLVVVGAGFAGASLLQRLSSVLERPGEALLVDRKEEYVFVPLIHEVAVGRIHPDSIRTSVVPGRETPYHFLRAEVTRIDPYDNTLVTSAGPVKYRHLVLAPGSVAIPPPNEISEYFQSFWSLEDALWLRTSLNDNWQATLRREERHGGLTVAIVGGGATGVELAAEIAALFIHLKKRTTKAPTEEPRVVLLEATDRLMGWLDPYFHEVALEELRRLGVEVRLNTPVTTASEKGIEADGEWLPAGIRVWVTGVQANPLVINLPGDHNETGRVVVDEYLTLPDNPEIYVLGDGGVYQHPRLGPLPPTASVAVQQGPYAARDLGRRLRGVPRERRRPFDFVNRGYAVSLGPESAVADPLGVKVRGRPAHALYRSIFLYYMKSRRERLSTAADWTMERTLGRLGFDYRPSPGRTH